MGRQPLLILLFSVAACGEEDPLAQNRRAWNALAIADYSYSYRQTGIAPFTAPHRITVAGRAVAAIDPADTEPSLLPTIDRLFDDAASMRAGAKESRVDFSPQYHFPSSAFFSNGVDGAGWEATAFTRN